MTEETTKKLMEIIRSGDRTALDDMLKQEPELLRFAAPNGSSVVLLAAYYGHAELVEVLCGTERSWTCLKRAQRRI